MELTGKKQAAPLLAGKIERSAEALLVRSICIFLNIRKRLE
jgi:hypothetical protein